VRDTRKSVSVFSKLSFNAHNSGETELLLSLFSSLDLLLEVSSGSGSSLGFELFNESLLGPANGVTQVTEFAEWARVSQSLYLKCINND
jgi:hypothetical protein